MTVKNYLFGAVRPVYKIWLPQNGSGDNPNMMKDLEKYREMYRLSRQSARTFLQGDFEIITEKAPILDSRMIQIARWYEVKNRWYRERCNILVMGCDTMFIKPTEVFGKYDTARMFNYTDPKHHPDMPHYFNNDIMYFPATMSEEAWEVGERHMIDWWQRSDTMWDCGQLLENHLLWAQGVSPQDMLEPDMAWQCHVNDENYCNQWNGTTLETAKMIHFHGSRGVFNKLEIMKSFAEQVGVDTTIEIEGI